MSEALPPPFVQRLRALMDQPPARARVPLRWQGHTIGSVEPELVQVLDAHAPPSGCRLRLDGGQALLSADALTPALAELAVALRDAGIAHVWRDEQLAVRSQDAVELGTIERAAVRPLGIPTRAVHLCGISPGGSHWVQLRSMSKATDPGLWDTLVGGMVPAGERVLQALERETAEEAGLELARLGQVAHGGTITVRGPSGAGRMAYAVETIDWYRCVVPEGVVPANRDGEVERFECLPAGVLRERLLSGGFTAEAQAILAAAAFGAAF